MTTSRRLLLAAALALAVTALAVAARRPHAPDRVAVTTAGARTVRSPRVRHPRTPADAFPAADTTVTVPATTFPAAPRAPRARMSASTFRRDGAAEPHSLQVISVPVPAQFGKKQVSYAVSPSGDADLLSAHSGTLPEAATVAPRATMVVTRVPVGAAAGPLEVARVEFRDDSVTTIVGVELTIARIRRIALRPIRTSNAVYPGQHARLDVVAQNLGNAPDTLRFLIDPLSGWRVEQSGSPVVLNPGEQRELHFDVRTPPPPASGFVPLVLRARADTGAVARLILPVELLPDASGEMRTHGPVVTAGIATSAGDSIGHAPVFGLAIDGPLSDKVALRGKYVGTTDRADYNVYAMGRIGYFLDGSFLTASGRGWSVTGGRTGMGFAPVFGWNAYGLGSSADLARGPWNLGLLAVQEHFGSQTGGIQAGAQVTHALPKGSVALTATHLEETIFSDHTLDAAGLSYQISPRAGLTLGADAGWRVTDATSGPAAALRLDQRTARGQFSLSAEHAAGGSGAFARATDALTFSTWRRLTEGLVLRGYGFGSGDTPGTGSTSKNRGFAVGPSVKLGSRSNVDVNLSTNQSEFSSVTGTITSTERMATLGARTSIRGVNVHGSIGGGQLQRVTDLPAGPTFDRTGGRLLMTASVDGATPYGVFSADGSYEMNDATTGQLPRLGTFTVQASRLRLFSGAHAPTLDASAWINSYAGAPTGGPAVRIGSEVQLPSQFSLMIDVERNPYLHGSGQVPWVAAVRFERSIGLPGIRKPTTQGSVFDDRNGNGLRDAGETGMAGVLVRRGEQSMLTRPDGSFKFFEPAAGNAAPNIDVGSLAIGEIAPTPMAATRNAWALPVTRTSRLLVNVNAAVDSLGRIPATTPAQVTVVVTDSTGAVWIGHPDSAGRAEFDALPAGRYKLTLDFTGSSERLRMKVDAPEIMITAGESLPPVQLPYGFRAVRVFDGGSNGPGGRRR